MKKPEHKTRRNRLAKGTPRKRRNGGRARSAKAPTLGAKQRRARRKNSAKQAPRKRQHLGRAKSAKALDLAVKRLKRAVNVAISRADSVLESTEAIAELAAVRARSAILSSLLDDGILQALHGLPQNEQTAGPLRMLARWLRDHFAVEPIYEPGREFPVSRERLEAFDLGPEVCRPPGDICSIRIIAAGWKRGNEVMRKPFAEIVGSEQRGG
jgi:hypothetical protein